MLRFVLLSLFVSSAALAECVQDGVDLRGDWGKARFVVEIADTDETRAKGLMHRESMPAMSGMLFIFPRDQRASFWMRNTLLPLDMLFLDSRGVVKRIHENAVPLDETSIDGGSGIRAVLEINGGMSARLGISEGSQLRHPQIPQSGAAWPCNDN